jgi:hypothetical protein
MSQQDQDALNVLRAHWQATNIDRESLDEECGPQKTCKNMKDVSFDGFGEPGADLASAWKAKLEREGKLKNDGQTIRDLVLGDHVN